MVVGTPRYMSPEQARGLHVDRRTDIFSVGCLLYELLSGLPTVTGATPGDVIAAILTQQPAPVESFCPDCPAGLSCLITRAMKKDCDERYQSCEEMLSDLKRASKEIESGAPRPPRIAHTVPGGVSLAVVNSDRRGSGDSVPPRSRTISRVDSDSAVYK